MSFPPVQRGDTERRTLPLGIQSFGPMRQDGHYYVDKTPHIERLVRRASRYFLSRPRRFGKSLLIDTLAELFRGSEELFRGGRKVHLVGIHFSEESRTVTAFEVAEG